MEIQSHRQLLIASQSDADAMEGPKKVGKIRLRNPASSVSASTPPVASGSGTGGSFKNGVKVEDFADVPKVKSSGDRRTAGSSKAKARSQTRRGPAKGEYGCC